MNTIHFDRKCVPNHDFVVVRIIDNGENKKIGNLVLAESSYSNEKMAFGKIEAVGKNAAKEYGLEVGQYILFDRLSTFYHTYPVAMLNYENVIAITNEDRSDYFPVKGSIFVEEDPAKVEKRNGLFLAPGTNDMRIGVIKKMNLKEDSEFPFKIGDNVMLVRSGDKVKFSEKDLYIFKEESVIVKLED